jgi:hypothetical protein
MLDTQGIEIANELFGDLGAWIDRQHKKNIPNHRKQATADLRVANQDSGTLRTEWMLQKEDQLHVKHRRCNWSALTTSLIPL